MRIVIDQFPHRFLLLLTAVLVFSGERARGVEIPPTDPNIQYHGRWNFDNPSEPWVYWQGSSIIVNFDGIAISLDIETSSGTEEYRIIVDGIADPNRLFVTGREVNVLASGLSPGVHTLQIMKETFHGD